jgi:hypothetical protein
MMNWFVFAVAVSNAEILINEVLYDPTGSDGPNEWIELCNNGEDDVDISLWEIQSAGTNWTESWTVDSGTVIIAGSYYLLGPGAGASSEFSPALPNSGTDVDGIRLLNNSGTVLDSLLYGDTNTNSLVDDQGGIVGPYAPDVSSGNTLARHTNCTDITNTGDDFVETETLTPNAENITPIIETCENEVFTGVMINEIVANPNGSDSGNEWLELYNSTEDEIDISGWKILAGTSSFSLKGSFAFPTVIAAGEYVVVGEDEVEVTLGRAPDIVMTLSMGQGSSSIDGVRLVDCADVTIDTVLYGDSSTIEPDWSDDISNSPNSFAPEFGDGQSIGRVPNGVDTNLSGDDFEILEFVTPWAANDAERTCDGQFDVKINEFLPNPHTIQADGTEISDDEGREWVELYNNSDEDISLNGWKLQWGGNASYSGGEIVIPDVVIEANGHTLIGGIFVENADVVTPLENDLDMTLASSNVDALRLLHCGPGVADTVIYGPTDDDGFADNPDEILDDSGEIAISSAPKASEGQSIGRFLDGVDTDQCGSDFTISGTNTPGESNPEIICGSGDFQVKINEIFPDPSGSDSGQEWVELYNAGSESVRLDSWEIQTASSSWKSKVILPSGIELEPGAFYLIGESDVPSDFADYTTDSLISLGNASTGLDGVRILNCLGDIEDTLLYGKNGAEPSATEDPFEDDAGTSTYAIFPDSGLSIGRFPDGEDSDDNGLDFQTNLSPTPASANEEGDEGTEGPTTPNTGCKKNSAPDSDSEPSKCSHVSPFPSAIMLLLLVGIVRRQ